MQIQRVIKERGFTLVQVAERMGITVGALSNSIKGNPTVDRLREIAEAVGCSRADFFRDEDTATAPQAAVGAEGAAISGCAASTQAQAPDASELPFGDKDAAPSPAPTGVGSGCVGTAPQDTERQSLGTSPTTLRAALVCPHCGHAIGIGVTDLGQG